MIEEAVRVLLYFAAGEILTRLNAVPFSAPVTGMMLLYVNLALLGRIPDALNALACRTHQHFGLFFIPAGAGALSYLGLIRHDLLPISAALLGGTVTTIGVTALVADQIARHSRSGRASNV